MTLERYPRFLVLNVATNRVSTVITPNALSSSQRGEQQHIAMRRDVLSSLKGLSSATVLIGWE
jgi:hypothetical protein